LIIEIILPKLLILMLWLVPLWWWWLLLTTGGEEFCEFMFDAGEVDLRSFMAGADVLEFV
jgi:hypothetical protein